MTLILTNHSGPTCHVYGYPGLAFFDDRGFPLVTHLTWMKEPHATVALRPGGSAQAMLTWRVNAPGLIALALMPCAAPSDASDRVNENTAPLVMQ